MTVSDLSPKSKRNASLDGPSFRNVSACKRCRLRKHRCDQSLPRCKPCEKAQSRCVGYDPISKREVPRSYVYYLENRLKYLDSLLLRHKIPCGPATAAEIPGSLCEEQQDSYYSSQEYDRLEDTSSPKFNPDEYRSQYSEKENIFLGDLDPLKISTNGPCLRGPTDVKVLSGTEIAKILSGEAVRTVMTNESIGNTEGNTESVRTSLFDLLFDSPKTESLDLPRRREEAEELTRIYFEHMNPYTPILHRDDFQQSLDDIYLTPAKVTGIGQLKLYTAFMVFAIGAANKIPSTTSTRLNTEVANDDLSPKLESLNTSNAPELYRSSAMAHLESYLSIPRPLDHLKKLEELQALILLCLCTLLRPTTPSFERLVHVAMRSATDLRLYSDYHSTSRSEEHDSDREEHRDNSLGRNRITDMRRRLWWSIYNLERLSFPYLGRPFFIPDEVVTTQYPSIADEPPLNTMSETMKISQNLPSYRYATRHVIKLRSLQSEIHRMIQYQHSCSIGGDRPFQSSLETSRSIARCGKFISWRRDMTVKLDRWRQNIPGPSETCLHGCNYVLELEYWQSIITLYRQNVSIPEQIVGQNSINPHPCQCLNESSEELTTSYCKLSKACQTIIQLYREMRFLGLSNISYFSTNWIFVAGSYFLCSSWSSAHVAQEMSFQEFDHTVLTTLALLEELEREYPLAKVLRATFYQMSIKVLARCFSTDYGQLNGKYPYTWMSGSLSRYSRSPQSPNNSRLFNWHASSNSQEGVWRSPFDFDQPFPMSPFSSTSEEHINSTTKKTGTPGELVYMASSSPGGQVNLGLPNCERLSSVLPRSISIKELRSSSANMSAQDVSHNTWTYQDFESSTTWPELFEDLLEDIPVDCTRHEPLLNSPGSYLNNLTQFE